MSHVCFVHTTGADEAAHYAHGQTDERVDL